MPLSLLALGSWLAGEHVVIVDGRFELAPEARVVELARVALCLGVTVRTGAPLREAARVSAAARAANPGSTIVWGGAHATLDPASCLATGTVDACALGAGEEPMAAAVEDLRAGRRLRPRAGLALARRTAAGGRPRRLRRRCGRAPTTRCSTSSGTSRAAGRVASTTARAGGRGTAPRGWRSGRSAWWPRRRSWPSGTASRRSSSRTRTSSATRRGWTRSPRASSTAGSGSTGRRGRGRRTWWRRRPSACASSRRAAAARSTWAWRRACRRASS